MLSIFIQHVHILGGNPPDSQQHLWLLVDLPLWKMMEFVSWENMGKYIPDIYEKKNVPNHQADLYAWETLSSSLAENMDTPKSLLSSLAPSVHQINHP